jgi:copper transport protein
MRFRWTLGLVFCLAAPRQAEAHASLLSSTPANGAVLSSSPLQVRLVFSEPIVADLSHVILASSSGRLVKLESRGDPHDVHAILAALPSLAKGGFRIDWHIISADGHPVAGSISFSIGAFAAPPIRTTDAEHILDNHGPMVAGAALYPSLLRGLALSALLALCGLLGFAGYSSAPTRRQKRVCNWLSVAATILLAGHLVSWLVHVSPANSLDSDIARSALSREVGLNELVRLVLTALAAWAVLLARRMRLAFAFALAAVLAGGVIGHPAAIDPLIAIPSKAIHLVGVAFWLGGLLWLVTSDAESGDVVTTAAIVSSVSLVSIVVVALTGVIQALLFLAAWSDLFSTAYGLTLIGKAAGLISLAAFGAYHRWRLMPTPNPEGGTNLVGSVRKEIALMIAVVLLGGFLAYVPVPQMHAMNTKPTSQQGSR